MTKKLLNFKEVCRLYSFTPNGLRWLIRCKSIPFVKVRARIYFDPADLDIWISNLKDSSTKEVSINESI